MAHFENRRFIVGGKPVLVLSGEIHYFRLARKDWHDRVRKAKAAGCNAVASYIPWIYHEETQGAVDLTGRRRPEADLGAFIDLCREEGLWFMARPGPFVMGEMKNEGIPDWIYTQCPEAIPTTWDGKKATSKTLSYLQPDFLRYVSGWYNAVMPILAYRLEPKGGNVIAVQLDNEIGMLQCWTEEADLSDDVLCEFATYCQQQHSVDKLTKRYPFAMGDPAARAKALRDGSFPGALGFHADYTEFTRDRFARYVATLRGFAAANGVRDVPFVINIHGSGGGRATTFPIGVSQTYKAYTQAEGYWGSSDHYLGELTRQNAGDLYFLNAFMACVNRPEQPLSSIEFEAGTGDYGENGAVRQSGSATDFKARLSVIQGNRMLNHYLLAGGHNPMFEHPRADGNSRSGTTGGRHGFAAPIGPEGQLDPTYYALKDTNNALGAVGHMLATMSEEHDGIALGFVPDYYSTDVKRLGPMAELAEQLGAARGPLEGLVRSMLACGLSFPAVNLQAPIPASTRVIALATAECLQSEVQTRLIEFVRRGGRLLLYGRFPTKDLEGNPSTLLQEALGVHLAETKQGSATYFPSLKGLSWAAAEPETRVWQLQPFTAPNAEPFMNLVQTNLHAGALISLGPGQVAVITAELPLHLPFWCGLFNRLGAKPTVTHDYAYGGIILNRIRDDHGQRFISLINLDAEEKLLHVTENGHRLFDDQIYLAPKKAKLLPFGIEIGGLKIARATTEIVAVEGRSVRFRQTPMPEWVEVRGSVDVEGSATVEAQEADISRVRIEAGRGTVLIRA